MRGQDGTVELLIAKADDQNAALLTPNRDGFCTYHLALKVEGGRLFRVYGSEVY